MSVGGKVFDKDVGFTEYRATVQVGVTHDSLCKLVELVVTDADVAASLCAQLNAAEAAEARGDVKTEAKLLNSFRKLVSAQTGKTIIASDATLLKNLSREL